MAAGPRVEGQHGNFSSTRDRKVPILPTTSTQALAIRHPVKVSADLPVTPKWTIPTAELSERFSRSSGPGGQGVNTTDSRVELSFDLAGSTSIPEIYRPRITTRLANRTSGGKITVSASDHRSQLANRDAARRRMSAMLADAVEPPPPVRKPIKRGRGARERRLTGKKHRGELKRQRRRGDPGAE